MPLDTIEDQPDPFLGREITVTGEVEDVLGPRVFTIDEPNWADFDNEVLVVVPSDLMMLVRPDDRITVTGTLLSVASAAIAQELARVDAHRRDSLADKSVIIARRIAQ